MAAHMERTERGEKNVQICLSSEHKVQSRVSDENCDRKSLILIRMQMEWRRRAFTWAS